MNKFVSWLFASMFAQLVALTTFLMRPMLTAYPLDYPALSTLFGYVTSLVNGTTPTYAPVAGNTIEQTAAAAAALADIVKGIIVQYKLLITDAQLAALLSAVATKLAAEAPAPA